MLKSNGAGGADGMQLLEYAVKGEENNQGLFLSILYLLLTTIVIVSIGFVRVRKYQPHQKTDTTQKTP
jgi:hypothetical protein